MKKIVLGIIIVFLGIFGWTIFKNKYTFMLISEDHGIKSEEIQPLFSTVKVSGDCDTNVIFIDVLTNEKYEIGYITHGMSENIRLEKGKWYKVVGKGNLEISLVNVRIE